jgi:hypothetical protein
MTTVPTEQIDRENPCELTDKLADEQLALVVGGYAGDWPPYYPPFDPRRGDYPSYTQ